MKNHKLTRLLLAAVPCAIFLAGEVPSQNEASGLAAVHEVFDTYFGVRVPDPYRWMEDTHSPELAVYLEKQSERMHAALAPFASQRSAFLQRIKRLQNSVDQVSSVQLIGDQFFASSYPPGLRTHS